MNEYLALIIDGVVLLFLAATIFYVLRLSNHLKEFKVQRDSFDRVITDLLASVDQAERTMKDLKQTGVQEVVALEEAVLKSKSLVDELSIMNTAGESLAKRLEQLAENGRVASPVQGEYSKPSRPADKGRPEQSQKIHSPVDFDAEKKRAYQATLKSIKKETSEDDEKQKDVPSFMIRDRDYDDMGSLERRLGETSSNDPYRFSDDEDIMPDTLQSQAEKDLLAALRGGKPNNGRG